MPAIKYHVHKTHCIWAQPILREFIGCKLGSVWIGTDNVMIDLELKVPQNLQEQYKLFRPYTIPVFFNDSATQINGLQDSIVLQWSDPPEWQILEKCNEYKNNFICDTKPNTAPGLLDCINGLAKNNPEACPLDSFKPQSEC